MRVSKKRVNDHFDVCHGPGTRQSSRPLPCVTPWHTAKVLAFVVCLPSGHTAKVSFPIKWASFSLFYHGPARHTAKALSRARETTHDEVVLCQSLYVMRCLSCVTHDKPFAMCLMAFTVCLWHMANEWHPVVHGHNALVIYKRKKVHF